MRERWREEREKREKREKRVKREREEWEIDRRERRESEEREEKRGMRGERDEAGVTPEKGKYCGQARKDYAWVQVGTKPVLLDWVKYWVQSGTRSQVPGQYNLYYTSTVRHLSPSKYHSKGSSGFSSTSIAEVSGNFGGSVEGKMIVCYFQWRRDFFFWDRLLLEKFFAGCCGWVRTFQSFRWK